MGGTGALWRPIAAALEDQADLLCPDQRGHGASRTPATETRFGPLDYATDVRETCDAENFYPAWVVGHSMGVRTACGYANLEPERVLGLILVDLGFSNLAGGGIGDALRTFLADLPPAFESREAARAFLDERCPDPSIAQYLMAVSVSDPATKQVHFPFDTRALLLTTEAARSSDSGIWLEEYARRTGRPVHILRGAQSRVYLKTEFEEEKKRFASLTNVRFTEVPGAGHGLPFEKRPEFVAMIRKWVGISER